MKCDAGVPEDVQTQSQKDNPWIPQPKKNHSGFQELFAGLVRFA